MLTRHGLATTKKVLPKLIPAIIVMVVLIGTIFSVIYKKPQELNTNLDPELARAMEYNKVKEGEDSVKVDRDKYSESDYPDDIYPYVRFDAFFLRDLDQDGIAEGVRGTCKEIGDKDTLYMEVNVLTNGYLEDGATIEINGDRNFYFETAIVKDNEIKENYIGDNTGKIELKEMKNGTQKLLMGTVKSGNYGYSWGKK